jgi:hypothetical protein
MAQEQQSFKNHARMDPAFHGFLAPGALLLLGFAIYGLIRQPDGWAALRCFGVVWAIVLMFKVRLYSLKVQDRVIRLEEHLRLAQLLPDATRTRIAELSERQLIALRFASDAELPGLVQKTLDGKWDSKQIKQSIQTWRPDHFRV